MKPTCYIVRKDLQNAYAYLSDWRILDVQYCYATSTRVVYNLKPELQIELDKVAVIKAKKVRV